MAHPDVLDCHRTGAERGVLRHIGEPLCLDTDMAGFPVLWLPTTIRVGSEAIPEAGPRCEKLGKHRWVIERVSPIVA
jgi:hypothetical protein